MLESVSIEREAERLLLAEFSPAAVLVDENGKIIYVSGHTNPYLEPRSGRANWNIFSMARNDIRLDLGELFRKALKETTAVRARRAYPIEGGSEILELTVQRLRDSGKLYGLVMVVFTPVAVEQKPPSDGAVLSSNKSKPQEIEDQRFREQLSLYREEMEISQAEARSANEELQSTNEELQSTNEEMTTSKEEMQSMNEELQTLNHELNTKLQDLMHMNNDLQNLMESTSIATIFLDKSLKVRLYTAGACQLFRLIPSDVGRILSDITSDFDTRNIAHMVLEVTSSLVPFKETILASEERWFEATIMPYVTQEKQVDGAVLTFIDVSPAKQLEEQLRASKTGLESKLRQSQEDVRDAKDAKDDSDEQKPL